jgi:predicted nucleic acid-binding protein
MADLALDGVASGGAVAPAFWWFEVRNLLAMAERRRRIAPAGTASFLADLQKLPIAIDRAPDSETVVELAREHALTVYDAAYLELALRLAVPLATLDRALADAAPAAGVELLTA